MCLGGNTRECSESGKSFFSNHICYTLGYSLRGGTLQLQLVQKSQEKSHLIVHKNFRNFVIMIAFSRKSKLFDHLVQERHPTDAMNVVQSSQLNHIFLTSANSSRRKPLFSVVNVVKPSSTCQSH